MKEYEEFFSETIENATDNIREQLNRAYMYGHEQGKKVSCDCKDNMEAEYNRGLNDAWETARKLMISSTEGGLEPDIIAEIFDGLSYYAVLSDVSASEAIAKIREYEEKQKQDTIKVWDEVYSEMDDLRFIVTRIITSKHMDITVKRYEGICTDGAAYCPLPNDICKTGRTFPQIAEILAEMRGEE